MTAPAHSGRVNMQQPQNARPNAYPRAYPATAAAALLGAALALLALPAAAQADIETGAGSVMEQRYCTQSGPFMMRFQRNRAAGFFAALPEAAGAGPESAQPQNAPGAIAGVLVNRTLEGVWTQTDRRGFVRMGFSDDWSSFVAAYALEDAPETWRSGWMGYLPPAGDPPTFVIDGDRYHCE